MSNNSTNTRVRRERKISASRLRRFMADIAEEITNGVDTIKVSASGNHFSLHLEGAVINISVTPEQKGGQA